MWSAIGAIVFRASWPRSSATGSAGVSASSCCVSCRWRRSFYCYQGNHGYGPGFLLAVFLMGGPVLDLLRLAAALSAELFRTPVRATGQGFCYNFGRIVAAIVVLQIGNLYKQMESAPGAATVRRGLHNHRHGLCGRHGSDLAGAGDEGPSIAGIRKKIDWRAEPRKGPVC